VNEREIEKNHKRGTEPEQQKQRRSILVINNHRSEQIRIQSVDFDWLNLLIYFAFVSGSFSEGTSDLVVGNRVIVSHVEEMT
jgi:hypothetical protein